MLVAGHTQRVLQWAQSMVMSLDVRGPSEQSELHRFSQIFRASGLRWPLWPHRSWQLGGSYMELLVNVHRQKLHWQPVAPPCNNSPLA